MSMTVYDELVARGLVAQVTDEDELKELINAGKAKFYIGFDATADSLHVGHFMTLCLMKRLQMAGNKPIALVGGGTTMIGDPSGRTDMRQMMTPEQINHNCECFKKQMSKFIDFSEDKALLVNNADWLLDLNYVDLLREVGAQFSVNRMLTAECYKNRMERGLSFLEFNYMIMQAYDFYHLYEKYGCQMQLGGNDQWSNMLAGTDLIRRKLGENAYAMTITLLLNSEGNKMGKTANGAVWLDPNKTSPFEFYQYWRNVADADVFKCMRMLTFLSLEEIEEIEEDKKEYTKVQEEQKTVSQQQDKYLKYKEKQRLNQKRYMNSEKKDRAQAHSSKTAGNLLMPRQIKKGLRQFKEVIPFTGEEIENTRWWKIEINPFTLSGYTMPNLGYVNTLNYTMYSDTVMNSYKYRHYLFGVQYDEYNKRKNYIYAIPGNQDEQPDKGYTGFTTYQPCDTRNDKLGYWLCFIDSRTRRILK